MAFNYNSAGIDPLLSDPENGDFTLQPDSPALGAGCQTFATTTYNQETNTTKRTHPNNPLSTRDSQEVNGYILEDTFWNADTIKVTGDITILEDVTLSIAAGTKIEFQDYYSIDVQGSIHAIGTADHVIDFTYYDPHDFNFDADPSGCWAGITFHDTPARSSAYFSYCRFEFSKGLEVNKFGGVFSLYNFSNLRIENSIFQYNLAEHGGAIGLNYFSNPILINNVFINNYALTGASTIYTTYSHPVIANNTFIENHVLNDEITYPTASIDSYMAKPKIYNNIFWDNWTNYYTNYQLFNCKPFYVFHNLILDGYDGEANIFDNPQFNDEIVYELSSTSPCIDAGSSPRYCDDFPVLDILGNHRLVGEGYDIGAVEYQSTDSNNELIPSKEDCLICYPNPYIEGKQRSPLTFYLDSNEENLSSITLFDLRGRKIKEIAASGETRSNKLNWGNDKDLNKLKSGIYLIKAETESGNLYSSKLILLK